MIRKQGWQLLTEQGEFIELVFLEQIIFIFIKNPAVNGFGSDLPFFTDFFGWQAKQAVLSRPNDLVKGFFVGWSVYRKPFLKKERIGSFQSVWIDQELPDPALRGKTAAIELQEYFILDAIEPDAELVGGPATGEPDHPITPGTDKKGCA